MGKQKAFCIDAGVSMVLLMLLFSFFISGFPILPAISELVSEISERFSKY